MVDYFEAPGTNGAAQGEATTSNGAAQPFTNGAGDLGMDDISVSPFLIGDLVTNYANGLFSERTTDEVY